MVGPGPTTHDFTVFRADITIAPKRLNRHGRACPGHPRFIRRCEDGLDTPGHNDGKRHRPEAVTFRTAHSAMVTCPDDPDQHNIAES
jgi:hypothetical protein